MGSHTQNALTVKTITTSRATKLRDRGGLWLVRRGEGRYWLLYYRLGGKRRELGIGPLHTVGLAEARQKAEAARALVRQGVDPIDHRKGAAAVEAEQKRAAVLTFGQYADAFIDAAVRAGKWRGAKTEAGWRNTLTRHAAPLRDMALADIGTQEVLSVLRPLWNVKQVTARKLRERLEQVLDAGKVEGLRDGSNPALWRGHLEHVLPRPNVLTSTSGHAAMPWKQVPAFMAGLRRLDTVGARALEFAVLTAGRSGEVRGALWLEIDFEAKLWVIPSTRMKAGREHRVPLSDSAIEILAVMEAKRINNLVFPGARADKPLSENTMAKILSENGGDGATVHGFRTSFVGWVTDATDHDGDFAQMALSHVRGDAVARAYDRSDALEKRRAIMDDWATFCAGRK